MYLRRCVRKRDGKRHAYRALNALLPHNPALPTTCIQAGLGDELRQVFDALSEIVVVLPTRNGITIRKRCISRPTEHQNILLQCLDLALPSSLKLVAMQ